MLSSRARYATRALLHLSLRTDEGPVLIQEIAQTENIPLKYLQQILVALKLAGFVQSRKGPGGGYNLAIAPEKITLGAVLRAMDGPISTMNCVDAQSAAECGCPDPSRCVLRDTFATVQRAMSGVLDSTTFAELRDRHIKAQKDDGALSFVI